MQISAIERYKSEQGFTSKIRDGLALTAILGSVIACIYNLIIFEDWNLSYFQIAGMQDIIMSAINMAFIVSLIIFPLPLLLAVSAFLHTKFRSWMNAQLRSKRLERRKFFRISFLLLYSFIFVTFLFVLMFLTVYNWYYQNEKIAIDLHRDRFEIAAMAASALLLPLLFAMLVRRIGKEKLHIYVILSMLYFVTWFGSFVNTANLRWFGYVGNGHIEIKFDGIAGCNKTYVLWMGERNSIIECWRTGKELDQLLFVLNNESGRLIGPVAADAAAKPPYSKYGELPPPLDRMTDAMKRDVGLR